MKELRDLLSNLLGERKMGREEGIAIGKEVGMAVGKEAGIQLVAKNLLKLGMPIQEIAMATGLSAEDIKKLDE